MGSIPNLKQMRECRQPLQTIRQTPSMQLPGDIGPKLNSRTHFCKLMGLLKHLRRPTRPAQRQRGGQAAYTATCNQCHWFHITNCAC